MWGREGITIGEQMWTFPSFPFLPTSCSSSLHAQGRYTSQFNQVHYARGTFVEEQTQLNQPMELTMYVQRRERLTACWNVTPRCEGSKTLWRQYQMNGRTKTSLGYLCSLSTLSTWDLSLLHWLILWNTAPCKTVLVLALFLHLFGAADLNWGWSRQSDLILFQCNSSFL